ncbi:MAG: phage tail tape measure protein, partial [Desulfobacteraceae bacterium]|nr:phage tail tape measure protein [Desulfobacteraceae bacterium]
MAFEVGAIVGRLELQKDQWEQSIKKVKADQKSLSGLVMRNSAQFRQMGRSMTIAGTAIVGAVGLMVKAYANFDQSMVESLAIMDDVSDEMKKDMAEAALEMSGKTIFAAKELAKGYFFLASAGMDAAQSIKALPVVAKFAQAGTFDLSLATDLLTDAQTALGLSSKNAVENQRNLIGVSDVLVKANTLANASVLQFSEALTNKAAAALVNVNKEMYEGVAILAAYADKGVKGKIAGSRLAMMLNSLDIAVRKNKKAWDENGLALFDAEGEMRSIGDIIGDLENKLGDMTTEQKSATLAALGFTVRTKASILTLMGSSEKIKQWTKDLKDAGGTTEKVADKQLQTFNNQMKLLRNELMQTAISVGGTLIPALMGLTKDLKGVIAKISEWVKEHPKLTEFIIKSTVAVGGLLMVLGPLMMMLPGLIAAFPLIKAGVLSILGPFGAMVVAILATGAAINALINIYEKKHDAEMDAMVDAAKGQSKMWAFRKKLIANEIVTVEEWGKIYEKHGRSHKRVMVAMAKAPEYAY